MTTNPAYEPYPRPAPFVAPERWEQPMFAATPPPSDPDQQPTESMAPRGGERDIEP
ncbi:MAG: hypothetical protein ACYC1E_03730 [Propionibacteriaceae bacterium]